VTPAQYVVAGGEAAGDRSLDMAEAKTRNEGAADLRVNEKKWTAPLIKAGWTVIPNVLFERQQALGLDPLDVNILLHIASYWWTPEGKPYHAVAPAPSGRCRAPNCPLRRPSREKVSFPRDCLILGLSGQNEVDK